jgi:hypothetical protein
MLIQSQLKRAYWRNALLSFLPDLLVAGIATSIFDQEWWFFGLVYVGLQAAYLLIWLKNSIWSWSLFFLFVRKEMARGILAHLREQKFPEPKDIIIDTDEYFQEVAENKDILAETRVSAATLAGFMQYPYAMRKVQIAFRMHMALEDAIHAYKAGFTSPAA